MIWPERDIIPSGGDENEALRQAVERANRGDSAAFDILFRQFNLRIFTYLARMVGNDEEGRDLTQETFVKAWRTLPGIQDASRFGPWLYRVATNVAIDHLRSGKMRGLPRHHFGQDDNSMQNNHNGYVQKGPEDQVLQMQQVREALALVSPKYRACLLLQIEGGFLQREIATMLHINEKSVSVYVRRGSEQFRRAYEHLERE